MNDAGSPGTVEGYTPPLSLWKLVQQYVPQCEQPEVKSMLGESKVEEAEELHQEVEMLLEIWQELHNEFNTVAKSSRAILPEPPGVRDRLKQEICFFLESIRGKAQDEGRDPEKALASYNANVIGYVLGDAACRPPTRSSSGEMIRPATALNRDGRETPAFRCTPNSDRMSLSSTISDDVELMSDKLNVLLLDDVVQHLRQFLEDEVEQLVGDVRFLQQCLDEEAAYQDSTAAVVEPNLTELREERARLEKEMLRDAPKALKLHTKMPSSTAHRSTAPVASVQVYAHQMPPGDSQTLSGGAILKGRLANESTVGPFNHSNLPSPTVPRPSSALRFRRMVIECRGDGV